MARAIAFARRIEAQAAEALRIAIVGTSASALIAAGRFLPL